MDVLRPQSPEAWRPGMAMAFAAHGLLLLAFVMGLQWQTRTPDVVEAEMWSEIPTVATTPVQVEAPEPAPVPVVPPEPAPAEPPPAQPAPEPEPAPVPVPAPKPTPAPVLKPAPAKVAKEVFMPDSPQVAAKLAKAREALAKASAPVVPPKAPEPVPVKPPEPIKPPEPVKPPEPPKPKPEPPKPEPPKPMPPPAVPTPPAKPVPAPVVATPASVPGATGKAATPPKLNEVMSRQELEKARQDNIKRMMGKLAEDALHAAGPSPEYQGRIRARIKPHIVYVDTQGGNPMTTVLVHCAPDGKIISAKVTIPSGSAAWDRAVLRALERTAVLPRNEQGKVLTPLQLEFKPRDF